MEKIKEILLNLKDLGCSGVKVSFEDEGALYNEIITMRNLTTSVDLDLAIKIGGSEAKRDIVDCIDLNCDSIVGPMIESKFALEKFIKSLDDYKYNKKRGFNLETITSYNNLNEISSLFDKIDYITFGRHDFVKSLYKNSEYVDDEEIYKIAENIFTLAKDKNKNCYIGGNVSVNSVNFIRRLINKNILDYFETRYIIFDTHKIKDLNKLDKLIKLALSFEYEWLKFIESRYLSYANKDNKRIKIIKDKINNI